MVSFFTRKQNSIPFLHLPPERCASTTPRGYHGAVYCDFISFSRDVHYHVVGRFCGLRLFFLFVGGMLNVVNLVFVGRV